VRLLLAEDEAAIAAVIAKGLREQSYAVDVAPTGPTALHEASTNEYDLLILDVLLPQRDGFSVCRELRDDGVATPILMLTARDAVHDRVRGLDSGADDYLTKPFDFEELLARVRALLRRGPSLRPSVIAVDDLVLDTRTRRVTRGGRPLDLTAKEYALLEYLARRQDEIVTRAEIAEHVWDARFDAFSNRIEVYVQRLRRKVDDGHRPLIRTRRGEGYTLRAGDEDA